MSKSTLENAFLKAKENKFGGMKIRTGSLVFSMAGETSINAGAIYVKTKDGEFLGKIRDGNFIQSRGCEIDMNTRLAIRYAMDNPMEAALTYGKQTGSCSICGRTLHAAESIANSIGPICAEKFGFFGFVERKDSETSKAEIVNASIFPNEI